MESKTKDGHRLNVLNDMETAPKTKGKDKARKELWDSLCAVYENEEENETNTGDKHVPGCSSNLPRQTKYDLKLSKKAKSKHLKKTLLHENGGTERNTAQDEDKEGQKLKELKRHKKTLNAGLPEGILKDNDKNVPSVIVLHKYKKGIFNTQTEPYSQEVNSSVKVSHIPEKYRKKTKVENKSNSQKYILSSGKSSSDNLQSSSKIEIEEKPSQDYKQEVKDKSRKKRDKGVVYKTLSANLETKLRKKRKKLERQQILKEVANTLHADNDIYDKIKTLPIKIDENQLIFMHPSHVAKALEHLKEKKINCQERAVNTDGICNEPNVSLINSINAKKDKTEASLTKLALGNRASSKRLRVLQSLKKMRKPIPIVLEEKSDISFIKVSKNKKEHKRRRSKLISAEVNESVQDVPNTEEESRENEKVQIRNNFMPSGNYSKPHSSVIRQNVCFGDNPVDTSNAQNDHLCTTLSGSLRHKSKFNKVGYSVKHSSAKEQKPRKSNQKELEKFRKLIQNNDESEDQIKPSVSEDEKKLTFQLLNTNMESKNHGRLRKNVYSVSDRRTLIGSNEDTSPALHNDRFYVTKRMLFYTNKESSSTSKESLNIAIRRDTEILNNGSSNNVLNVVIKQKKNSVTSTKSMNSPKLDIDNKCSKHCDTKSLEKMFVENYLEQICKDKGMNKNKDSKEAECQTELNVESNKGGRDQASSQAYDLGTTTQDDFRSFLMYHLQNMNPTARKSNAVSNNHEEEMFTKKQTLQSSKERISVESKFGDDYSNFVTIKPITSENENNNTKSSRYIHSFVSPCCTENNCNPTVKQFYRVLDNDEHDLQNLKCDNNFGMTNVNTSDDSQIKHNESDADKGIPKLNEKIAEYQCQKTESENIAEKLKTVGLSDKRSFIKVINSNYKLGTSINTKIASCDTLLQFKPIKSPRKRKDSLLKQVKVNAKDDFKRVITKRPKSQFSPSKNKISLTCKIQNSKVSDSLTSQQIQHLGFISAKENCLLGNDNTTDTCNLNIKNVCGMVKTNTNNYYKIIGDNFKYNKQHFVNILSANEDMGKKNNTKEIPQNPFEVTKKTSYCTMRNFIVSEVGVQTETCDLLPSIPYKNVCSLKKDEHSNFHSKKQLNAKEITFFKEKPDIFNSNKMDKLLHFDRGILSQEKGSFVHVVNENSETDMQLNKNKILFGKKGQANFPTTCPENKHVKKIRVLNSFVEDKQIVDKINAIYGFLQYLDKMLKDNSFLKLGANKNNTYTIGHFNSTLRCLCNNCMEILNKIEGKDPIVRNKLYVRKSFDNLSQPKNNSFLSQIIGDVKNECSQNDNNFSNVTQYNNNDNSLISSDLSKKNPFFVVLPSEENVTHNHSHFLEDIRSRYKKFGENKGHMHYRIPKENFNAFLPLETSFLEKPYEHENNLNLENYNNNLKCKSPETAEMLGDCINNASYKLKPGSYLSKDTPDNCISKPQDHEGNSCVDYKSSKTFFNPLTKVSSKNKWGSSCCKSSICPCFLKKNTSSGEEIEDLQNENYNHATSCKNKLQPTAQSNIAGSVVGLCKDCSNIKSECCCFQNIKPNMRQWLPMMKSPFKMSLKKYGCTAKKYETYCPGLSGGDDNETIPTEKNIVVETKLQGKNTLETQHKSIPPAQPNSTNMSGDGNHYTNCQRDFTINLDENHYKKEKLEEQSLQDSQQRLEYTVKGHPTGQLPIHNAHPPLESMVFERNLQKDDAARNMTRSNSVEFLYNSYKENDENEINLEDRGLDSDGWVPLSDVEEIENNKIYFGMDLKDMTVSHVEYVQKFPENLLHCKTYN